MPCKVKHLLSLKEWAVSIYRLWKPSMDPRFPAELERIIFEFAARNDRFHIPTLMCVAPRVKQWLEPILLELIIYKDRRYRTPGRSKIITKGKFVRHLLLPEGIPQDLAWDYLRSCPNLQTLSFAPDKLGLSFEEFSDDEYQLLPSIDLPDNCPKYQHLTHLQLMTNSPLDKIDWLSSLPNLTHLLILGPMFRLNEAVKPIFARCHRIQVMLWCPWDSWSKFRYADHMTRADIQGIRLEELEPRLVVTRFIEYDQYTRHFMAHSEGWKWGGNNAWKKGEEVVDKRLLTGTTDYQDIVDLPDCVIM